MHLGPQKTLGSEPAVHAQVCAHDERWPPALSPTASQERGEVFRPLGDARNHAETHNWLALYFLLKCF